MGIGVSIGMSVLGRHHPRLGLWLAIIFAALFAVYAVGLAIASGLKYGEAQRWSQALRCNCYERVPGSYLGSSHTGNKGELSLKFRDSSGDREVLVIDSNASAWTQAHITAGQQVPLIEWSGKVPAIDLGGTWIQTEDYPSWDAWDVAAPGLAAGVALIMLLYAREMRGLVAIDRRYSAAT